MRTLTITSDSPLSPARALQAAHDSTAGTATVPSGRSQAPRDAGIAGECADGTEGTGTGIGPTWQRCRYDWSNSRYMSVFGSPRQPEARRTGPCPQARLKVPGKFWSCLHQTGIVTRTGRRPAARRLWQARCTPRGPGPPGQHGGGQVDRMRAGAVGPGVVGARQVESSLLTRAQRAAVMTSDPTQQASITGKPPGEPLAPRTTDQNTHSGAKALINSSDSR
jgi:hypothetical protein